MYTAYTFYVFECIVANGNFKDIYICHRRAIVVAYLLYVATAPLPLSNQTDRVYN